jgi:hypothetical protein
MSRKSELASGVLFCFAVIGLKDGSTAYFERRNDRVCGASFARDERRWQSGRQQRTSCVRASRA